VICENINYKRCNADYNADGVFAKVGHFTHPSPLSRGDDTLFTSALY